MDNVTLIFILILFIIFLIIVLVLLIRALIALNKEDEINDETEQE